MEENKSRLNDQELSVEELEAIFSGPSLADSAANREELVDFAQKVFNQTEGGSKPLSGTDARAQELSLDDSDRNVVQRTDINKNAQNKSLGSSLSAQLNLMASGASDIAARRTSQSEYEVSTFAVVPEKKAEVQAVSEVQSPTNEELSLPDPNSPEALRERIKAYKEHPKEKNLMAQSLGIVFSFGFTVAAVILAFWYLGQWAVECSGRTWLAYPCIIFGVLLGLYSGALVLKPFLKGALPVVPSAKNKLKVTCRPVASTEDSNSETLSSDDNEGNG